MNKSSIHAATLFALLLGAASTVQADNTTSDQGDFARGARAWADNCMRCHNARYPTEFPDRLWKPIVYHMRVRGGLTGQETRDILKYLQESN